VVVLWAENIVHIFNADPGLVAQASDFLRIAVAGYIVMGFMAVLMQSLSGAGDTVLTMVIGMLTVWTVTLPLAYCRRLPVSACMECGGGWRLV